MTKCSDSNCYNHDETNELFCEDCLLKAVMKMSPDDLYEIYLEGENRVKDALMNGEAHGLLSPDEIRATKKLRRKWFKTINKFMLTKFKE